MRRAALAVLAVALFIVAFPFVVAIALLDPLPGDRE